MKRASLCLQPVNWWPKGHIRPAQASHPRGRISLNSERASSNSTQWESQIILRVIDSLDKLTWLLSWQLPSCCKRVRPRPDYFSVWKTVFLSKKHKTTNLIFFRFSFFFHLTQVSSLRERRVRAVCVCVCVCLNWSETWGLATTIMPDLPNKSAGSITSNIQTHKQAHTHTHWAIDRFTRCHYPQWW